MDSDSMHKKGDDMVSPYKLFLVNSPSLVLRLPSFRVQFCTLKSELLSPSAKEAGVHFFLDAARYI